MQTNGINHQPNHLASRTVIIVCNAIDDSTRVERSITTDSPAATKKVLYMAKALRATGQRPFIFSLGRGRENFSAKIYRGKASLVEGIPFVYAPFSQTPVFSKLLSLFGLVYPVMRIARRPSTRIVFYNRCILYLLTLYTSKILRAKIFLDLEDGEVRNNEIARSTFTSLYRNHFDKYCASGAILATSALARLTSINRTICYYGVAVESTKRILWGENINLIVSGTLAEETGISDLIDAIKIIKAIKATWSSRVTFHLTGSGPLLKNLQKLSELHGQHSPNIRVHGRLGQKEYEELLSNCQVGLSLKPVNGPLADTTFPSKTIEYAAMGLLVIATDISDVRKVLGDNGDFYIRDRSPLSIVKQIERVIRDIRYASLIAEETSNRVTSCLSIKNSGIVLKDFVCSR